MAKKVLTLSSIALLFSFTLSSLWAGGELPGALNSNALKKKHIIKNPRFTHMEKGKSQLRKINTVKPGKNEKYFIGVPSSFTMDEQGNLYVFDRFNYSILKFDSNFRFVKHIGSKGKQKGQFSQTYADIRINAGKDGNLYAADAKGGKIISFSRSGKFLNQLKGFPAQLAPPVVDEKGNIYLPSINKGLVDIYDKTMILRSVFLDVKELDRFLVFEPMPGLYRSLFFPSFTNVKTSLLPGGRVAVYVHNSSKLYVIKNNKILVEKYLWPKHALEMYKTKVAKYREESPNAYRHLFIGYFLDGDDDRFFYLQFGRDDVKNLNLLYKFDFNGNLVKVLYSRIVGDAQNLFKLKKGNQFISVDRNKNINIFKEI